MKIAKIESLHADAGQRNAGLAPSLVGKDPRAYEALVTLMYAHVCAAAPSVRIMEIDPDTVPWYDDLVTVTPTIIDGHLQLPTGPGWGTEVNEDAVRAHPPRKR